MMKICHSVTAVTGAILAGTLSLGATGASGAVLFQDSFETGNLATTQNGVRWTSTNYGTSSERPTIVTNIAHTGARCLRFTFAPGSAGDDAWSEQRFSLGRQMKEIYVRWFQWFPMGTGNSPKWMHRNDTGPDNNKFLRLWDNDYNNYRLKLGFSFFPSSSGNSIIGTEYGTNGRGVGRFSGTADYSGVTDARRGRWVEFQAHARTDSGSGNGVIELWVDKVKTITNTTLKMYPYSGVGNYFANGYLMGWANSGFNNTGVTYIDDVTIADTFIQ